MKQQYLAAGIGRPDQYTTIFSGFALEPFLSSTNDPQLRARLGLAPDDVVIGKIARLFKLKGHDDLFAIAPALVRSCPQIKFLLVGDGPWRGRFESRARSLGLEKHVVFTGLVAPDGRAADWWASWTFSCTCRCARACPARCPRRWPPPDPSSLTMPTAPKRSALRMKPGSYCGQAIWPDCASACSGWPRIPALRERLGRRGQQFVQERFGVQRMVDDLYQLYAAIGRHPGVSFPFNVYLLAAVSACVTVLAALPLWRKWCLRTGLVDEPGQRKIHDQPIPLAGGLAVMTGLLVPTLLASLVLWWQKAGGNGEVGPVIPNPVSLHTGGLALLDPRSAFLLQYGLGRRAIELAAIFLGAFGMHASRLAGRQARTAPARQVRWPVPRRRTGRRQRRAHHALRSQHRLQLRHHHPVDSHASSTPSTSWTT